MVEPLFVDVLCGVHVRHLPGLSCGLIAHSVEHDDVVIQAVGGASSHEIEGVP
jgi:hypothetical protein